MVNKKGIPKEVLEELDIRKKILKQPKEVAIIVEEHQAKIPIPKSIRLQLKPKKGDKCKISYDSDKKEIICKF